jgi:hypothetical protein
VNFGSLLAGAGAVFLLVTGARGLARRELTRRRRWGEVGGPRELPPIRGRAAVLWSLWLIAAGAGLLVWTWRR